MKMKTNSSLRLGSVVSLAAFVGCGLLTPRPDVIAERFWDASMDGDFERAAEYVTSSSVDLLERNADAVPELDDVSLGDVEIDGDEARVHTQLTAMINDQPTEVEFETVLEKQDGQWRVDLRATSGQMIAQLVGEAAGEFMDQIGELVGEQMRGMFDGLMRGLADGMDPAGQSRQDAHRDSSR